MDILVSAVPFLLFGVGSFYLIKLKFFYFLHPVKTFSSLFEKRAGSGVSPLSALSMALAGTLGVGNIVGVASAICLGGAGAVFWMIAAALLAMVLKYAEIVLAVLYRRTNADGKPYGGAPYYIRRSFEKLKLRKFGKLAAGGFCVLCIFNAVVMGNALQVNTVAGAFEGAFGISPLAVGIAVAVFSAVCVVGGVERIARITGKLVPIMSVFFIGMCIAVLALRAEMIPYATERIFSEAFNVKSAAGGVVGFIISGGVRYGTMRGLISNEAGCGTATMAHATADAVSPSSQGVLGLVEVFVDTVLMCTLTALVILVGVGDLASFGDNYILLVQSAFGSVLGEWSGQLLAVEVLLFGVATVLCQSHYGRTCLDYFTRSQGARFVYYTVFCVVSVVGSVVSPSFMFVLADGGLALMTFINLAALVILCGDVKAETQRFLGRKT